MATAGLKTLSFADVEVGQVLPELVLEMTPTMIVSTALATRDFQDVHHDRDLAQKQGSKDIFMNILTSAGFLGRYVTDWAGPEALLRATQIRLGAPNYPYDTMRITGEVTAKEAVDDEGVVTVAVRGANKLGDHMVCTVKVALPLGDRWAEGKRT